MTPATVLYTPSLPDTPARHAAQSAVRALLEGAALPAEITPQALGSWAETVRLLGEAQASAGAAGVHRAFVALARQEPALVALLAGDGVDAVKTLWTVAELYAAAFAAPRMMVEDLLSPGLTILAGRPKLGKSWLALQIAVAVGTGGCVLGLRATRGRVLFLALEDTPRRLRDRLQKQDVPDDAAVTFATAWEPLSQQGLVDLMVEAANGYSLIIVDTLSRAIGRADQMDASDMTLLMSGLQRLAMRYDLALLLIDHHRKLGPASTADPVDDIFGSTAKAGVVDAALGLYKQRSEPGAVLKITGRDLCERELALQWDPVHFGWGAQGDAQEIEHSVRQQAVLETLGTLGKAQVRDLADATGQDRSNLFRRLQSLLQSGQVVRIEENGQVFYSVAPVQESLL